jgi:hypothetical protein
MGIGHNLAGKGKIRYNRTAKKSRFPFVVIRWSRYEKESKEPGRKDQCYADFGAKKHSIYRKNLSS